MSRRVLLFLAVAVLAVAPGCRSIKTMAGIGEKITQTDPGTPERLIQDVLKAALNPDEEAGWEAFEALLHSEEMASTRASREWKESKYPSIRRKAASLVLDPATYAYRLMDERKEGDTLQIFVKSTTTDVATPCRMKPDPEVRGAWRVFNACF